MKNRNLLEELKIYSEVLIGLKPNSESFNFILEKIKEIILVYDDIAVQFPEEPRVGENSWVLSQPPSFKSAEDMIEDSEVNEMFFPPTDDFEVVNSEDLLL